VEEGGQINKMRLNDQQENISISTRPQPIAPHYPLHHVITAYTVDHENFGVKNAIEQNFEEFNFINVPVYKIKLPLIYGIYLVGAHMT